MSAISVERHMFTVEEVVAAILPNAACRREIQLRVDTDGYVVIDFINPLTQLASPSSISPETSADQEQDDFPGDRREQQSAPPAAQGSDSRGEPGPREAEARGLCSMPLFRAFLEVKTEEAAMRTLAHRCHVQQLSDLDRTRSNGMNLRHVVEEFEAWKIT